MPRNKGSKNKGYSGIKYKSTVCESAKDIVLFDKTYAHPVGDIEQVNVCLAVCS